MAAKKVINIVYSKHVAALFTYLLIVWGFYRLLFFQFPTAIEVTIIKPLVWLLPVYVLIKKEKLGLKSLGVNLDNLFPVVYFTLTLGFVFAIFAMIINYLKYSGFNFGATVGENTFYGALVFSIITAVIEEITFRGYITTRLWSILGEGLKSNVVASIGWTLIHVPVAVFDWRLSPGSLTIYLLLTLLFSLGATFVYGRTKNIAAPILLHILWQWPIILFR